LQWLRDPSEINGDNLRIVRREASRYFRNKKRESLKDKINELARNSKNKNIRDLYRGINEFKRDYQPRNNLVKDENGDLLADSFDLLILSMLNEIMAYASSVHSNIDHLWLNFFVFSVIISQAPITASKSCKAINPFENLMQYFYPLPQSTS
jgi:hypothetical protein